MKIFSAIARLYFIIFVFNTITCDTLRDPFEFKEEPAKYKCLAIGKVHNKTAVKFAYLNIDNEFYYAKVGDQIGNHVIDAIEDNCVFISSDKIKKQKVVLK